MSHYGRLRIGIVSAGDVVVVVVDVGATVFAAENLFVKSCRKFHLLNVQYT